MSHHRDVDVLDKFAKQERRSPETVLPDGGSERAQLDIQSLFAGNSQKGHSDPKLKTDDTISNIGLPAASGLLQGWPLFTSASAGDDKQGKPGSDAKADATPNPPN